MSWRIKKLGYSAGPWRIVDDNGTELALDTRIYKLRSGEEPHPLWGHDTKAQAIEALGRYAERSFSRCLELEAELAKLRAQLSELGAA